MAELMSSANVTASMIWITKSKTCENRKFPGMPVHSIGSFSRITSIKTHCWNVSTRKATSTPANNGNGYFRWRKRLLNQEPLPQQNIRITKFRSLSMNAFDLLRSTWLRLAKVIETSIYFGGEILRWKWSKINGHCSRSIIYGETLLWGERWDPFEHIFALDY